jgi:hypothetical protein
MEESHAELGKNMENMEENSEMIWKIWKKSRLNCEKDMENTEEK